MSPIREKFIKILESLPYDLDKEILNRDTKEILQEITQKYVNIYGIADLSENKKLYFYYNVYPLKLPIT